MLVYLYFVISHIAVVIMNFLRIPLVFYILIIMSAYSIVAFSFDPVLQQKMYGGEGVDLYRHFESLDLIRIGNGENLYMEAPLSLLYLSVVANLFDNNHILPLVSTWIFYAMYFYLIISYCKCIKADDYVIKTVICIGISFLVFFGVMNNIRYPIAMGMFMLVFYQEFIKEKISKIWYVLPVLMHPGIAFLLLIRLLANIKFRYIFMLILPFSIFVILNIENILQTIISFLVFMPDLQNLIVKAMIKMYSYSSGDEYAVPLLFRVTSLYVFIIFLVLSALAYNYRCKLMKNEYFVRMIKIITIVVLTGEITNYMDGNFSDRIIGILPFFITMLSSDILVIMNKMDRMTIVTVKTFLYGSSLFYLSIWLFKVYLNWIYGGLE